MKKLIIHCLQHVSFEGPAIIREWALRSYHEFRITHLNVTHEFPDIENIDWLLIMGGPMGVHDHEQHPWLKKEIEYIQQAIERSKVVIGICLGAQLIAKALGAEVRRGKQKEIGWFPVQINKDSVQRSGLSFLPEVVTPFHWHQETFDIPTGAIHLGSSKAFPNQAFLYKDRVLALQFHFEMDSPAIEAIIKQSGDELNPKQYIQGASEILHNKKHFEENHRLMYQILDKLETS